MADCTGVWGGPARQDGCSVCGGDNSTCADCANIPNGPNVMDNCGNCVNSTAACSSDCSGVWGGALHVDVCEVCGGDGVCREAFRVNITLPGGETRCSTQAQAAIKSAVSDSANITLESVSITACIVDGDLATLTFELSIEVGSRRRMQQYGPLLAYLRIGIAGAAGVEISQLNTSAPITLELDCDGVAGGNAVLDSCGVCAGDNSTCMDCAQVPNGASQIDECEICDDNPSNDCPADCLGIWGGGSQFDSCNVCNGTNASCADCAGVPNGLSKSDRCGSCDTNETNDCARDCSGVWGGSTVKDICGICGGANDTCLDW
eukprot:COSAG05_NODE_2341_length_3207_cov_1.628700_2_plen_319_part_00